MSMKMDKEINMNKEIFTTTIILVMIGEGTISTRINLCISRWPKAVGGLLMPQAVMAIQMVRTKATIFYSIKVFFWGRVRNQQH